MCYLVLFLLLSSSLLSGMDSAAGVGGADIESGGGGAGSLKKDSIKAAESDGEDDDHVRIMSALAFGKEIKREDKEHGHLRAPIKEAWRELDDDIQDRLLEAAARAKLRVKARMLARKSPKTRRARSSDVASGGGSPAKDEEPEKEPKESHEPKELSQVVVHLDQRASGAQSPHHSEASTTSADLRKAATDKELLKLFRAAVADKAAPEDKETLFAIHFKNWDVGLKAHKKALATTLAVGAAAATGINWLIAYATNQLCENPPG